MSRPFDAGAYYSESYPPSLWAPVVIPATGATAGTPGTFTPPGSTPPPSVAGMAGLTASPATAWTTGQYVQTGTAGVAGQAHWSGTAWAAGAAVVAAQESTHKTSKRHPKPPDPDVPADKK